MNVVLVTGAAGFVGSSVVKELLNNGKSVIALDLIEDPSSRIPIGNRNLKYFKIDISDLNSLRKLDFGSFSVDTFYHFAWMGSSGPLREDYECQINNALITLRLMEFAKEIGASRFIFSGTIMEFETHDVTYNQGTEPQMSYIYGVGKQLAHSLCKPISNKIGIDLIWAYITNTYGVGEISPRLINTTIRKCINHEQLNFTSGTQNYDFIYIDDVARAFYLLGEKGKSNYGYVIGSGEARPLRGFLEKLVSICDNQIKPNFGSTLFTGTNLPLDIFSIQQLQEDCNFIPRFSFEQGVKMTYEWLKKGKK